MIKRTSAIVFILLANILLLVLDVVPHHHHNKQVCFVSSHCDDDNSASSNKSDCDNHNHDDNSDCCILKEPVIVLNNESRFEPRFHIISASQTGTYDFFNNSSEIIAESLFYVFSSFVSIHFNNKEYSSLVSESLGLRAPPFV